MNENSNYKMDVELMIESVKWELEKASVLIDDIGEYFLREKPTKYDLQSIEANYRCIAAKLALLDDVLDNVEQVMQPMEEAS